MNSFNILSQLEQLDDEIDDLEESLEPLLITAFSETTSKLPLLDKAKLYVLVTYAIESALFSYLRLHGVQAREHPVFTELTRVKQYFAKVKNAEEPVSKPAPMSLDKEAAGRFIKAGLSGNDKFDSEKAERIAKEKAKAHIRFTELSKKRKAEDSIDENEEEEEDSDAESEPEVITGGGAEKFLAEVEEKEEEEVSLIQPEEETLKSHKKEKAKPKTKAQKKAEKETKKEAKKQARLAAGLPEKKRESHAAKKARKAEKKKAAGAV